MWDEITPPFPNFNRCTIEVWEWINDFIPHLIGGKLLSYPTPIPQPPAPYTTLRYPKIPSGGIVSWRTDNILHLAAWCLVLSTYGFCFSKTGLVSLLFSIVFPPFDDSTGDLCALYVGNRSLHNLETPALIQIKMIMLLAKSCTGPNEWHGKGGIMTVDFDHIHVEPWDVITHPCLNHWNGDVVILMTFSSLIALEVVKMTTSSAVSDENFVKMMTFSFQWIQRWFI